jgi:hypothetical protein
MSRLCLATAAGAVWLVTLLVACQTGPEDLSFPPDTHAVVGTIAIANLRDNGHAQLVLVDCVVEPPSEVDYDTVGVFVPDWAALWFRDADGSLTAASRKGLVEGALIRTYYSGIMTRSIPPGITTSRVEISRP